MNDHREFIEEFLVEATENLDQRVRDLIALEVSPEDCGGLASICRTVPRIKGNSGFFGFSKLGALTHSGEHLLGRLRDGKIRLNDRVTGTLYSMIDAVRSILESIESTGVEGEQDFRELSRTLAAVAAEESAGPPAVPAAAVAAAAPTRTNAEPVAPPTPPPPAAAVPRAADPATSEGGQATVSPLASEKPLVSEKTAATAGPTATAS
ncbi:MAG: Hpt domain-containing protein, partial [Planctomycetia bacterium]